MSEIIQDIKGHFPIELREGPLDGQAIFVSETFIDADFYDITIPKEWKPGSQWLSSSTVMDLTEIRQLHPEATSFFHYKREWGKSFANYMGEVDRTKHNEIIEEERMEELFGRCIVRGDGKLPSLEDQKDLILSCLDFEKVITIKKALGHTPSSLDPMTVEDERKDVERYLDQLIEREDDCEGVWETGSGMWMASLTFGILSARFEPVSQEVALL